MPRGLKEEEAKIDIKNSENKIPIDLAWENNDYVSVLLRLKEKKEFPNVQGKPFILEQIPEGSNVPRELQEFFDHKKTLSEFIQEDNLEQVKNFINTRLSVSLYLKNTCGLFEIFQQAIICKKFEIYTSLKTEYSKLFKSLTPQQKDNLQQEINKCIVSLEDDHIMFLLSKSKDAAMPLVLTPEKFLETVEFFYRKLNDISEISPILHVLAAQHSRLKEIIFDFTRKSVVGTRVDCSHTTSGHTSYEEGRIDVGAGDIGAGDVGAGDVNAVLGTLAHELTHFAMHTVYENKYNPYGKSDSSNIYSFKEITEEIIKKLIGKEVDLNNIIKDEQELATDYSWIIEAIKDNTQIDDIIKNAFTNSDKANIWYSELIVRIPHMLAKYENNGIELLNDQVPKLYDYYRNTVLPKCKTFIKESDLIRIRNNIELLSPYIEVIEDIKKIDIEFEKTKTIEVKSFLSQKEQKNFLFIETKTMWLSSCNVYQALKMLESHYLNKSFFLRLDQFKQAMFDIFMSDAIDLLVMIIPSNFNANQESDIHILKYFNTIRSHKPYKKIIFLIPEGKVTELQKVKLLDDDSTKVALLDDDSTTQGVKKLGDLVFLQQNQKFTLNDLKSQHKLLEKKVTFMGKERQLNKLIDNNSKYIIDGEILEKLINGESMAVGSEPIGFSKLEAAYTKFYEKIQKNNLVDALFKDELMKEKPPLFMISSIVQEDSNNANTLAQLLGIDKEKVQNAVNEIRIIINTEHNNDINLEQFKKLCHDKPNQSIYWINWENNQFIWQQLYNPIYLTRQFQKQVVIKKDIKEDLVKTDHSDLFIFSGIANKEELITILEISKNQKKQFLENQRIRVIHSDSAKDNDIENIFQELCVSDNYIHCHWLKIEKIGNYQQLIWNRSHGSLNKLRKYIDKTNNTQTVLDEAQFSEQKDRVVIIADKPGMGKSTTLTYLSDLKIETNWIIRINLKDCQEAISQLPNQKALDLDDVVNFLSIIDIGLNTLLAQNLVRYYIKCEPKTEPSSMDLDSDPERQWPITLLLDGFDEIKGENHETVVQNQEKVIKLLKYLKDKTKANLWVTTRAHGKENLENELSVFATTLKEILSEEQQKFLEDFWKGRLSLILTQTQLHNKLGQYAETLLEKANTVLGEKMPSFMGIPLQLRLLAEYFQEKFKNFIASSSIYPSIDIPDFNLLDLYHDFINKKYEIYLKEKTGLSTGFNKVSKGWFIESLTKLHQRLAFYELFPSKVKDLLRIKSPLQYNENELVVDNKGEQMMELYNVGLIQLVMNKFEFIHQTFAEYFAVDLLAHLVRKPVDTNRQHSQKLQMLQEFLLKEILIQDYQVIRAFFNAQLAREPLPEDTLELYGNKIDELWQSDKRNVYHKHGQTILHIAAIEDNEEIIRFLLDSLKKDSTTFKKFINAQDHDGNTVLHLAARYGKWDVVKLLVEKGASVNAKDKDGNTVLHLAARYDKWDVVKLLVKIGADVNAKDKNGNTVLHLAARYGKWDVVKLLVEIGASVNAKDNNSETVLHLAAWSGNLEVVELSVENGANVNTKDKDGNTVLHLAARYGKWDVVKLLVEKGAGVNAKDNYGSTVFHSAARSGNLELIELLLKNGANVNAKDKDGNTVFHFADMYGNLEVVELLLKNGADVNAKDKDGNTVFPLAARSGNLEEVVIVVNKWC